jgi:hypothetical protein
LVDDVLSFGTARVWTTNVAKPGRPWAPARGRRRHVRSTDANRALSSTNGGGTSSLGAAVFGRELLGRAGSRGRRVDWRAEMRSWLP